MLWKLIFHHGRQLWLSSKFRLFLSEFHAFILLLQFINSYCVYISQFWPFFFLWILSINLAVLTFFLRRGTLHLTILFFRLLTQPLSWKFRIARWKCIILRKKKIWIVRWKIWIKKIPKLQDVNRILKKEKIVKCKIRILKKVRITRCHRHLKKKESEMQDVNRLLRKSKLRDLNSELWGKKSELQDAIMQLNLQLWVYNLQLQDINM